MASEKITSMPSLAGGQVPGDLLPAVDLSASPGAQNVKITLNDLFATITKNITDRALRFQSPGTAPTVSASGQGSAYFDGTKFQISQNGGAYAPIVTGGSITTSGLTQATARLLGRTTAGTGAIEELTAATVTAFLDAFVGDSGSGGLKGLVPAPAAGDAAAGKYLKADGTWATVTGGGTVTSVGLSMPSLFVVSGSPVTGSGTLTATLTTQAANLVFAGPSTGSAAVPTFRSLVAADIPVLPYASSGSISSSGLTQATARLLGRTTAGTGAIEELTAATVTAFLDAFVGDSGSGGTKGMVPAPAAGDAASNKYLKADGSWATVTATANPAGSNKQIQYNNSGSFGGAAGFEYQSGASPNVLITAQAASRVPLFVNGATAQAAALQQWAVNSALRVVIDANGYLYLSQGITSASVGTARIYATSASGTNLDGANLELRGGQSTGTGKGGSLYFYSSGSGSSGSSANAATLEMELDAFGNLFLNPAASGLATTATDGFLGLPSMAGIPTGTPSSLWTGYTNTDPITIDRTNYRLYAYLGAAWRNLTGISTVSTTSRVLGRQSSGSGAIEELTASNILDFISATRGTILYRGATNWVALAPGTSGQVLQTQGAGADPIWASAGGGGTPGGSTGDYQVNNAGSFAAGVIAQSVTGRLTITPSALTTGSTSYFRIITPADTTLTASTQSVGIQFGGDTSGATVTRQFATGALTTQREYVFVAPTYSFVNATTITTAATVAITGAPALGTNATITNRTALLIEQGGDTAGTMLRLIHGHTTTGSFTSVPFGIYDSGGTLRAGVEFAAGPGTWKFVATSQSGSAVFLTSTGGAGIGRDTSGNLVLYTNGALPIFYANGSSGNYVFNRNYQMQFGTDASTADVGFFRAASGVLRLTNASTGAGQWIVGSSTASTSAAQFLVECASTSRFAQQIESASGATVALANLIHTTNATAAIATHSQFYTRSSGTAATGLGGRLLFGLESSTTNDQDAAAIAWSWTDAANATRTAKLSISLVGNAAALASIAEFDMSTTAGDTRFFLWDVDKAALQRVLVGAVDSGGTGYKMLRVAN